jgi:hypothetical protein
MWASRVSGLRFSRAAMAMLERPSAISASTSSSRGVRAFSPLCARSVQESIDDGRVDDAFAGDDSGQGVDDDLDIIDAVLEQIAQVFGGVVDQAHRPFGFDVLGGGRECR